MQVPGFLRWLTPGKGNAGAPDQLPAALNPASAPASVLDKIQERAADPEPKPDRAPLAPYPAIDRYPNVLGSTLSLAYISSVFRLALTGYRREFCDVIDELLERDPHLYAVVAQRVHAVAGGRITVVPAKTEKGSADEAKAQKIADYVDKRIQAIPDLQQSIAQLQWGGVFYGVGAAEISWRQDAEGWYPARLHWIHSRRIAYPDPASWSARIWDQGMVSSWDVLSDPTGQLFGLRCEDFPGKFIVHAPSVRGNYPTRDGLGRQTAYWSALKLMGARGAAQYVERFGKPWTVGYYSTQDDGKPRAADDDDIKALTAATGALGIGSLASATLPDSTKVDLAGPGAHAATGGKLVHDALVAMCNREMSKAVLGQTDTVEAGPNGSRSATETRKRGTQELYRFDAACMGDSMGQQLVRWIVRLNFPEDERLCPSVMLHPAEEPDPDALLDRAVKAASGGAPVDADKVCQEAGVPLLPKPEDGKPQAGRRMFPVAALKPYELQSLIKLEGGEELIPPPKLIEPSAEAGGNEAPAEGGAEDNTDANRPPKSGKPAAKQPTTGAKPKE